MDVPAKGGRPPTIEAGPIDSPAVCPAPPPVTLFIEDCVGELTEAKAAEEY